MASASGGGFPDPTPLIELSTAYWGSLVLLKANRLGLFEILGEGPAEVADIAGRLQTDPRATALLLNACVAHGLLSRAGERYANAPLAACYLQPDSPAYMGMALRYSEDMLEAWTRLEDGLRSGRPPLAESRYLGQDPELTGHFVQAMHNRALAVGRSLVDLVDLEGASRLLDVGGGPGTYSALLLQKYPNLHSTVLELPPIAERARPLVEAMGVGNRLEFLPGSLHDTPLPDGQDAVLISGVLHRLSPADVRALLARAVAALAPGGRLVISDVFTDAGGDSPAFATLFGLNMFLSAPDGGVHADADVADWMREAGTAEVRIRSFPPPMPHRVLVGSTARGAT